MSSLKAYRKQRVRKIMEQSNVDVLIASLPQHILYLTGFPSLGATYNGKTQNYAVYSAAQDRTYLVISASDAPTALECSDEVELVCHGSFHFDIENPDEPFSARLAAQIAHREPSQPDAVIEALRRCGAQRARVAFDESRTPFPTYLKVRDALPEAEFVPGVPVFEEIRCIKHPDEVAGIERSTHIAEDALLAAIEGIRVGHSEHDIEMSYRAEVAKREASALFCTCTVDPRTAYSDSVCTRTQKVHDGSVIRFDYGANYEFYCSDLARTVLVGKPDARVERDYRYILDGLWAAEAAMKPGVPASEAYEAAMAAVRRGIPGYTRHHCGHGIGIQINDIPSIAPSASRPLEEGMVFCVETPYYVVGRYGIQIEDTVVVTKDGVRRLAHTSNDLIYIPART